MGSESQHVLNRAESGGGFPKGYTSPEVAFSASLQLRVECDNVLNTEL